MDAIRVTDLCASYGRGGADALRGVSFCVGRGEIISIIGRNGAGKSTLCRCVVGAHARRSGSVEICGADLRTLSPRARARLISHVPQSAPTDAPFTVREFLRMSRYAWRGECSRSEENAAIDRAMELCGVARFADRRMMDLSGGERQKVMLASAAAQGAPCVVMDEPTTYLDYAHQADAMRIMKQMNREHGASTLIVTHDVNLALQLSDRVVALTDGQVAFDAPPSSLSAADIAQVYGVELESFESASGRRVLAP